MKEPRVFPIFLVLLLSFTFTACGEIPEPIGVAPVAETEMPEPTAAPSLTPTTLPSPTPPPVQPTLTPEQPGLTVFRGSGIVTVVAVAVDPVNPEIIYAGAYHGLFRSTDGGSSWHLLNADLRYPQEILIDPTNPQVLYARRFATQEEKPRSALPGIYKSTDGGFSWQVKGEGTRGQMIFSIALDPSSPQVLYAGSWDGIIFKSIDAGENWTEISDERPALEGFPPWKVVDLLVHPRTGEIYALEGLAGTFKSSDGGRTWAAIHRGSGYRYLTIDTETDTLYLAGQYLWKSTDGGESWQDISGNLPYDYEASSHRLTWVGVNSDPPVLYVGWYFQRVYRSTDGGVTWSLLDIEDRFRLAGMWAGPRPVLYGSVYGILGYYVDVP